MFRTVFGANPFGFFLGLNAVYPATVQQMLVEPLQVQRSEICQRDAADLRLDVVFQKALRGFEGGRSEFYSGVVLHPDFQPCSHGVSFRFAVVDSPRFPRWLFFSFFFFTSACVLPRTFLMMDFPVSGSWPTVYRPSQRPSFRLRMFPSPFARLFRHDISPFRNEQYRNQGNKATEKPNCYQKVIICPSEPRRLIFDYCGAISALPEETLLWLQRCDF